jgi:hypothetical protein
MLKGKNTCPCCGKGLEIKKVEGMHDENRAMSQGLWSNE